MSWKQRWLGRYLSGCLPALLLVHAFFILSRVCKIDTPTSLFATYLMTEVVSSFYTKLDVGKE